MNSAQDLSLPDTEAQSSTGSDAAAKAAVRPAARGHAHARPAMKTLLAWHWISSAVCLVGLVLFALTGLTLNHADVIESKAARQNWTAVLPPADLATLAAAAPVSSASSAARAARQAPAVPTPVLTALATRWQAPAEVFAGRPAEWSPEEVYVPAPGPGRDRWLRIDLASGEAEMEVSSRGAIAVLNDLHKGRHTGWAWSLFLDVFALACLVFTLSGLWILHRHAPKRRMVWPLVGLGLVLPGLLALAAMHG